MTTGTAKSSNTANTTITTAATGTRVCICPNCRILMTYSENVTSCPKCTAVLTGEFPGIPKKYDIAVSGRSDHFKEDRQLKSTPFEKLGIGMVEFKQAIKWILAAVIIAPILLFIGSWITSRLTGSGMQFLGFSAIILGPVSFLLLMSTGLEILVGEPRGATPQEAFRKIWRDALFEQGKLSLDNPARGHKKSIILYRKFLRAIHPIHRRITQEEVISYAEGLKSIARSLFDAAGANLDLSCKNSKGSDFTGQWHNYYSTDFSCRIDSEDDETAEVEGNIRIAYRKNCKITDGEIYTLPVATVNFTIRQKYVKCGEFWAPADPLPLISQS